MANQNRMYEWFLDYSKQIIASFLDLQTVGLGDVMLDIWLQSEVERPNPECPKGYDLLNPTKTQSAGGAANVAVNIGSLGGDCSLIGVVGDDQEAKILKGIIKEKESVEFFEVVDSQRPTTSKTRFSSIGKGIARVSFESLEDISASVSERCLGIIGEKEKKATGFFVEDYGKGVIQKDTVAYLVDLHSRRPELPIIFDPKIGHGACYRKGMCSLLKPNWKEACDLLQADPKSADRAEVVRQLSKKFDCDVLVTLGGDGAIVYEKANGKTVLVPTRPAEDRDITGAGDTIVATLTLALAGGMTLVESAVLANCSAGVVVRKKGTASVDAGELVVELERGETREIVEGLFSGHHLKIR